MQNFEGEWKKFSAREVLSTLPITAIRMHKTLCQDIFFDLSSNYITASSYNFSTAYFYDFFKITKKVDWKLIYVLDGVEYLHRFTKTDKPLVRDRALYSFIYLAEESTSSLAEALITNPWLNDLCTRPVRLLSERAYLIKSRIAQLVSTFIYSSIVNDLDVGYTPRGIWGLDYMFKWKDFNSEAPLVINASLKLIPLDEYVKSFS